MTTFTELLQQGTSRAWLFVPSAVLLGALHGLEPGHSKTLMAAFIVAIRGTIGQAVLLGLSATISHTAVVWIIALLGLHFSSQLNAEGVEPYMQLGSALIIVAIAIWMAAVTWRRRRALRAHAHDDHHHEDDHDHHHDDHQREHAQEIKSRFTSRKVSTGRIVLFGLTGGLVPCPASITVLLICLQLKQFSLGVVLVLCFSVGLALTLVAAGVAAAWGIRHAATRWTGFGEIAQRAPYVSSALILVVGLYTAYLGWRGFV